MKTILLSLSLCLGSLLADEAEKIPVEELKIDPLLSVKEQFSKARKKGWDFSDEKKKAGLLKKSWEFNFGNLPSNDHQQPEDMAKAFRNEISHVERAKMLDRMNERDHTRQSNYLRKEVDRIQKNQKQKNKSRH